MALDWVIRTELEEKERDSAARLIQLLYRFIKSFFNISKEFTFFFAS